MTLRTLLARSALAIGIVAATTGMASANIIEDIFTGNVTSGSDTAGIFGTPNSDLAGDPFIATYWFDDNKGAKDTSDNQYLVGQSIEPNSYENPTLAATLMINGHTHSFAPNGQDSGYFVFSDVGQGSFGGGIFDEIVEPIDSSNTISLMENGGHSLTIPGNFDTPFTTALIPYVDREFHIGLKMSGSSLADGVLSDTSVTVLVFPGPPTPEPATWALMFLGAGLTGGVLRTVARTGREFGSLKGGAIPDRWGSGFANPDPAGRPG